MTPVPRQPRDATLRARIGLIIPSSNRRVEQELIPALPPGVVGHVARLRMTGPYHAPLPQLLPRIGEAAATLADADCDVIVFNCTASSMEDGQEGERMVLDTIERASGRRAITTGAAVMRALRALAARRVALVTPYDDALTAGEIDFLGKAGLDLAAVKAMHLSGTDAYCSTPSRYWVDVLAGLAPSGADTYFLSCANICCLDAIDDIERRLDRPLVTSNQAVIWDSMRLLGMTDRLAGLGRLGAAPGEAQTRAA